MLLHPFNTNIAIERTDNVQNNYILIPRGAIKGNIVLERRTKNNPLNPTFPYIRWGIRGCSLHGLVDKMTSPYLEPRRMPLYKLRSLCEFVTLIIGHRFVFFCVPRSSTASFYQSQKWHMCGIVAFLLSSPAPFFICFLFFCCLFASARLL